MEAGSCRNVVLSGFFVMRVSTVLSSRSALFVVDALESVARELVIFTGLPAALLAVSWSMRSARFTILVFLGFLLIGWTGPLGSASVSLFTRRLGAVSTRGQSLSPSLPDVAAARSRLTGYTAASFVLGE